MYMAKKTSVKRHTRKLPSGKITDVRKHYRTIPERAKIRVLITEFPDLSVEQLGVIMRIEDFEDVKIEEVNEIDFYGTDHKLLHLVSEHASFPSGAKEFVVFDNYDQMRDVAEEYVIRMLEDEPELFSWDWLQWYVDKKQLYLIMEDDFAEVSYDEMEVYFEEEEIREFLGLEDDVDIDLRGESYYWYERLEGTELFNEKQFEYARYAIDEEIDVYFPKEALMKYIDIPRAAEDSIDIDGVGHFLGYYDSSFEELGDGSTYVRVN